MYRVQFLSTGEPLRGRESLDMQQCESTSYGLKQATARRARFEAPVAMSAQTAKPGSGTFRPVFSGESSEQLFLRTIEGCVEACLKATTSEAYLRCLEKHWETFVDAMDGMQKLLKLSQPAGSAERAAEESAATVTRVLLDTAAALDGEAGKQEADFATQTYRRALRLLDKLHLEAKVPSGDRLRDLELSNSFWDAASTHVFGLLALTSAASDSRGIVTPAAIRMSFQLLRDGALEAYAAVREAIELRAPQVDVYQQVLAVDSEDDDVTAWAEADL